MMGLCGAEFDISFMRRWVLVDGIDGARAPCCHCKYSEGTRAQVVKRTGRDETRVEGQSARPRHGFRLFRINTRQRSSVMQGRSVYAGEKR